MAQPDHQLDLLVAEILRTAKYRAISPDLVRLIGGRELATRRSFKQAVKETKARLHQVAGAFLDRAPRYDDWLADLRGAAGDEQAVRAACRRIMAGHASTRERLPYLEPFYQTIFAALPPVGSLIDAACGLNPLAAPWMGLGPGARYLACDLYADLCAFVGAALPLFGLAGEAIIWELAAGPPPWAADVALVLKTLPVLEHIRRGAGHELLRGLAVSYLVVSFPTRSLGGRNVGMAATYSGQIQAIVAAEGWASTTREFPNEIVYIITR